MRKINKPKLVRIPPDIMKDVIVIANEEMRSIPKQIEKMLRDALIQHKAQSVRTE